MRGSAEANAVAAHAAVFARTATKSADDAFRCSAIATAQAIDSGVSAVRLARLYGQATAHLEASRSMPTYTSDVAVGYHARTGRLLLMALPEAPATPREVQAVVKAACAQCGTRAVDRVLRRARSQQEAFVGLCAEMDRQLAWRLEEQEAERQAWEALPQEPDDDESVEQLLDEVEALINSEVASWATANRLSLLAGRAAALLEAHHEQSTEPA